VALGLVGALVAALIELEDRSPWMETAYPFVMGALAGLVIVPLVLRWGRRPPPG
jgi:hypothetical protein